MQRHAALCFTLAGCVLGPTDLVPPTVDEDLALPAIELGDSRFYLERRGAAAGTPIVFLAGGPGNDASYLTRLADACDGVPLGASHPLLFWDQRGTGQSRRHDPDALTFERFFDDLERLVDAVAPDSPVILVGHSWGGMYATAYADRHPARVAGLVLLEPGELTEAIDRATPSSVELDLTTEWLNDFAWGQQVLTDDDHAQLDFYSLLATNHAQPGRRDRERVPIRRLGAAVIRSGFLGNFYPDNYDFTTRLGDYQREVLIVAGDQAGGDLGADFQRAYHLDLFPRVTLEVIAGASHSDIVWADACKTVNLVRAYLLRVAAEAS